MSETRLTSVEVEVSGLKQAVRDQTAVIQSLERSVQTFIVRLETLPDHESRIRVLEEVAPYLKSVKDHELRLRALEVGAIQSKAKNAGIALVVGSVAPFLPALFAKLTGH